MNIERYRKELRDFPFDLSALNGKTLLISGATGMIASYLIGALLENRVDCRILAIGRNEEKARARFGSFFDDSRFGFVCADINSPLTIDEPVDYVIHAASNTHPLAYATDPIGTVTANIIGLKNMLDYAADHSCRRFVFLSSVEVYGENRGDTDLFSEDYCGYINCNTLRAGYPESKRAGEALCQAYIKQKGMDIVVPRLSRVFGPTLLDSDSKALSQFIHKAIAGEDIVLKSEGKQFFSYLYVADVVTAILTCMLKGGNGETYNVSDGSCDITLKELAETIASIAGTKVVFDLPGEEERRGYSTATKAVMNAEKIRALGWQPRYSMKQALRQTIEILK